MIRAAQYTPFRSRGVGYAATPDQLSEADPRKRLRQGYTEFEGVDDFYRIFPELPAAFAGKDVLDYGCGYGGKTVAYARLARFAAGIEPVQTHIELSEAFRRHRGVENAEFRICTQAGIPYPDDSFDIVVSHDVIEHVDDPASALAEIHRVLRPGGIAYLAFPPYDGMLSHHLDYVSTLPGLHLLFSPETLVDAANREIDRLGLAHSRQPAPRKTWDGGRAALPTLNGLTSAQFDALSTAIFDEVQVERRPVAKYRGGFAGIVRDALLALGRVSRGVDEFATVSLHCRLRKAGADSLVPPAAETALDARAPTRSRRASLSEAN
ncbi:class I SAM-dependent methyltransferase [Sphingomonas sp. DG1-23]|uniref:class I SAM-dependent methyltransferase n=1 Tax=Sphingomonas sp. DG1-23 TaxID=3068316 RepID=UPI00273D9BA6|nr:class I SAM-dependent methyltransferase [Sphingomonas sp. DG1-23]MDP5277499.1 class I SAM-dependent methyltransferase [Sphingomonas sp. DG1-23]